MSPLAVAQYLGHDEGSKYRFDVCVIDEASMIPTADVALAISLADQVVVTGDSKQMPPTSFFDRATLDPDPDPDPATGELPDPTADLVFESILDEAGTTLPSRSLLWHYRSRDESLIAFSNAKFYGGSLMTFPAPAPVRKDAGVRLEYVEGAVYGRGGSRANPAEAERAVELLLQELREHPEREVAVTAMSTAQQSEINGRIEQTALENEVLRGWVGAGGRAKNLETVQGDECDTMILSLGYGRDATGRMILNFGPLATEGGQRRWNVAVTRARWKTILVASITAGDISPERATSAGALALRDYLDYAERGAVALAGAERVNSSTDVDSSFEQAVLRAMTDAGLACVPQVGAGSYRVDIGVLRPGTEGEFVLGVECDGAAYRSAASARDRDVTRPFVLENMGWRVHRVWSASWFKDPRKELAAIVGAYQQALGDESRSVSAAPAPAASAPEVQFQRQDAAGTLLRTATRRGRGTGRSADISRQEAVNALVIAIRNSGPAPEDSAVEILKGAFDLGRASDNLRSIALDAIEAAVRAKLLRRNGGMLEAV
jgi:very-short-patch-repair endonuclease